MNFSEKTSMFGHRLADERQRLGLSQGELADAVGLSRAQIGNLETERTALTVQALLQLQSHGFDMLHVLTGEPAKVVAGKELDWMLCEALIDAVKEWCAARNVVLPPEKKALIHQYLYVKLVHNGVVERATVDEVLKMAA